MKDKVIRILKNHKQSTLDGLHQITGGNKGQLLAVVEGLIEDGILRAGVASWNGTDWVVYKLKKNIELNLDV